MVDRRHFKDSLLAQFVGTDLQNHRKRFDDEDPSDEGQQQFLLDDYGDRADGATQGQRSDVAHKNFSGMRVVPEESDSAPTMAPQKIVSSPTCGMRCSSR